jgi:ABC-2 type transport system permease protein
MTKFFVLFKREVGSFFCSPIAYVVLFFFLLVTGFNFHLTVSLLTRGPTETTLLEAFFNSVLFWITFLLIFPLITMRSFSEEFRSGTIETLMTAPVGDWQVVLSKYFACLLFYCVLWAPSALYFRIFEVTAKTSAASSPGAYAGAYLALLLMGVFYISIGCFTSVVTRNQIIAAVMCFAATMLLLFLGLLSFVTLNITPELRDFLGYFSAVEHMSEFSKGVLDSRPIVYYLTMTALFLTLTHHVFQSRKWKSVPDRLQRLDAGRRRRRHYPAGECSWI